MISDSAANTDTTKSLRVGDHPVPSMGAEQVESIVLDRIPATALRRITTPPSLSRDCRPPDLHKRTSLMSSMTVAPRVYPNVAGPASVLERHRPWIHAHTRGRSSMNTFSGGREGRRRGVKALRRSLEPALSHSTDGRQNGTAAPSDDLKDCSPTSPTTNESAVCGRAPRPDCRSGCHCSDRVGDATEPPPAVRVRQPGLSTGACCVLPQTRPSQDCVGRV